MFHLFLFFKILDFTIRYFVSGSCLKLVYQFKTLFPVQMVIPFLKCLTQFPSPHFCFQFGTVFVHVQAVGGTQFQVLFTHFFLLWTE